MIIIEHEISQRIRFIINEETKGNIEDFAAQLDDVHPRSIHRLFKRDAKSGKFPVPKVELLAKILMRYRHYSGNWLVTGWGEEFLDEDDVWEQEQQPYYQRDITTEDKAKHWEYEYHAVMKKHQKLQEDHILLLKDKLSELISNGNQDFKVIKQKDEGDVA